MLPIGVAATVLSALSMSSGALAKVWGFRMVGNVLTYSRMDPIIQQNGGGVSDHVHLVIGGSRFRDVLDTTQDMLKANCTTVAFAEDKSNYWQPALYYINPDGTYSLVHPHNIVIYYQSEFNHSVPFPEGMRMITGNAMRRDQGSESFQGTRIYWAHQQEQGEQLQVFPTKAAPEDMRTKLHFPSCGLASQDLDSPDHFSHMAFPLHGGDFWVVNGNRCPDTHPIAYPQIVVESFYDLTAEQKANWRPGQANLVWANGDTYGDTFHGDFVNGWPTHILQQAIDKKMEAFNDSVKVIFGQDGSAQYKAAQQCLMEGNIVAEDVGAITPLKQLPGFNPLWGNDIKNKPTGNAPKPGFVTPNLRWHNGLVLPGQDTSNPSGFKSSDGKPVSEWPLPNRSTQQQVNDANKNGTPNRASVPGLENLPGFTNTKPTTIISNYPTDEVAPGHRTQTWQCTVPNQPNCGPGPTAR